MLSLNGFQRAQTHVDTLTIHLEESQNEEDELSKWYTIMIIVG